MKSLLFLHHQQSGATLPVTLLLLFIITLLTVSAMQVSNMQEKMAANLQDKELSFNAAESALSAAENWLINLQTIPPVLVACTTQPCVQESKLDIVYSEQTDAWWQANSAEYNINLNNIALAPRYLVEFLQFTPDSPTTGNSSLKSTGVYYYQITSKGTGSSNQSISILQTTVGRRY